MTPRQYDRYDTSPISDKGFSGDPVRPSTLVSRYENSIMVRPKPLRIWIGSTRIQETLLPGFEKIFGSNVAEAASAPGADCAFG